MNPLSLVTGGIGLAKSLFGGGDQFRYPDIGKFSFNPNLNDPELALLRQRAMEENQINQGSLTNEIGRAGLLGTSAQFNLQRGQMTDAASHLDEVTQSALARQRAEQLDLFNREAQFKRDVALAQLGGDITRRNQSNEAGLGALGGIGETLGYNQLQMPEDYSHYLTFRKPGLPIYSLMDAANIPANDSMYRNPSRVRYLQ